MMKRTSARRITGYLLAINSRYSLPAWLGGALLASFLTSCGSDAGHQPADEPSSRPTITHNGDIISFPENDTVARAFWRLEKIGDAGVSAEFTAIGKVGATIVSSSSGAGQNIVLFENPELASNYTQLIQHQINIRQIQNINIKRRRIELERARDLHQHGVATGQELLNAETALSMEETSLANEKAALIEHEVALKSGGFDPKLLRDAKAGTAYLICDIPENQIGAIRRGSDCDISFSSFPNEKYTGKIDDIADVVDNLTRMIRIRVSVNNSGDKLKSGMFAHISFSLSESGLITISKTSLVTVQGKNYVFVKTNPDWSLSVSDFQRVASPSGSVPSLQFERREVRTGKQIGDRIIVFDGLNGGDEIAVEGVMQLKGLSFGY